jgi:formate hydrogenlyase subunit 3/multisubunit Na+/H+ antiporter MnhD subunit
LGFAVGGNYGLVGALLYMAGHAVAKAGLFYATGVVQDATGTDELSRLGGFARRSPTLAVAAAALLFSVIGLPPMVGFFAKLGVMVGAASGSLLLAVGAAGAALFTLLYLGRFYAAVFLGDARGTPVESTLNQPGSRLRWMSDSVTGRGDPIREQPVSRAGVALVVLMALVVLAGGLMWFLPAQFLAGAAGGQAFAGMGAP